MLDDFSTPPSSPPLGGVAGMLPEALRHHNIKASSVTWCTDYLEVMGCEKQHNFKVSSIDLHVYCVQNSVVCSSGVATSCPHKKWTLSVDVDISQ